MPLPVQRDADDTWCVDPRGVLTLCVSKTLYEQLGLVGQKVPFKGCPERYGASFSRLMSSIAQSTRVRVGHSDSRTAEARDDERRDAGTPKGCTVHLGSCKGRGRTWTVARCVRTWYVLSEACISIVTPWYRRSHARVRRRPQGLRGP